MMRRWHILFFTTALLPERAYASELCKPIVGFFSLEKSPLELLPDFQLVRLLTDKDWRENKNDRKHRVVNECLIEFAIDHLPPFYSGGVVYDSLTSMGDVAHKVGNYDAAIAYMDRLEIVAKTLGIRQLMLRGDSHLSLGRFKRALVDFERAEQVWRDKQSVDAGQTPDYISKKIEAARARSEE
jgi:tetratricopeptide (TPR) repeat protein